MRPVRSFLSASSVLLDLRYALRVLAQTPLLTAALIGSLGIGVGANAAVFNFISALLLRPPAALDDPGSLAIVRTLRSETGDRGPASHADLTALRGSGAFEAVAAFDDSLVTTVTYDGTMRQRRVAAVTADLFRTLGMDASQGRLLERGDTGVAVISHQLWEIVGRPDVTRDNATITIQGVPLPIVGVAPHRFRGLHTGRATDVWRLLPEPATEADRRARHLAVIARTDDHEAAGARLGGGFRVMPYAFMEPDRAAETGLLAAVLSGAIALVLICACVNAASLLLSRGNARRRDLAVKLALGANRSQLLRQLLLESGVVGIAGGCAGLLFAFWTATIVPSMFAPEHAEMLDARLSAGIILVTLIGSTLLGIGLGVLPALYGTAPVTALDLRGDAGAIAQTGMASRLQTALVVTQIALSTVLLVSALLLHRSLSEALEGDLGAVARNVAVATISEPPMSFEPVSGQRDFAQILGQVLASRRVLTAGFAAVLPVGSPTRGAFTIETAPGVTERIEADTNIVSPAYFETMRTPVMEGRGFDGGDAGSARAVAIINDVAMRRFFDGSALGRTLAGTDGNAITIVGVVQSGRFRTMQESPAPMVYRPLAQTYLSRMYLVMRLRTPPSPDDYRELGPALRAGRMQLVRVGSLDQHFAEAMVLDRFVTTLVSACGLMALVLAITGADSLMLDSVRRRTREIGLRIALGASAARISGSIVAFGVGLTAAGVAAGLAVTLAVDQIARMFVFGLPRTDAVTMGAVAGTLLAVVLMASVIPVFRAVRVNPTIALRHT